VCMYAMTSYSFIHTAYEALSPLSVTVTLFMQLFISYQSGDMSCCTYASATYQSDNDVINTRSSAEVWLNTNSFTSQVGEPNVFADCGPALVSM
jgi:hypothetical protein